MANYEQVDQAPGYEGRAAIFVDRYRETLDAVVKNHLRASDRIVDGHGDELEEMLERGGWTESDLVTALNLTSSSVGKLLSRTYSEVDGLLEQGHKIALGNIPVEDERQWGSIQRQIGRSGLDSDEVKALFEGASSKQSAAVMRIACDYPLWLFIQQKAGENGMHGLQRFIDAASQATSSNAINVGMDYPLWRALQINAIKYGPDQIFVGSTEDASDARVTQAMNAGLDYRVAVAVYERRSYYDRGFRSSPDMSSALESATPFARQAIELTLGGRYDKELRAERQAQEHYRSMGDEAAESFGGRPYSFEELLRRMLNIREGRDPRDDGEYWEEEPANLTPDPNLPNPYQVLGVSRDAEAKEVKSAFRRLAREHHPDAGGDLETAQRVIAAYEILSDPGARAHYDMHATMKGYSKRA